MQEPHNPALASSFRTMLAFSPEFTGYELHVSPDPDTGEDTKTYSSGTGSFQLTLPGRTYTLTGKGFTGDRATARTAGEVSVTLSGGVTETALTLSPYYG